MRRGTKLALVAGGAIARSRLRGRGPAIPKPVTGIFANGMAYVRWGTGPKTLLLKRLSLVAPTCPTPSYIRSVLPQDVLDFVRQRRAPGLETGGERPSVRGEPVGTAAG
jgi:hypothetical protein